MNIFPLRLALLFAVALCQFSCAKFTDAQTSEEHSNTIAVEVADSASNEAFIVLKSEDPTEIDDRAALLGQPVPAIKFVFDCAVDEFGKNGCEGKHSISIPSTLEADIAEYWQESLKFGYRSLIQKFPDAKTNTDESIRFSILGQKLRQQLLATNIPTDQGDRPISGKEAGEIIRNINQKAIDLVRMMPGADK